MKNNKLISVQSVEFSVANTKQIITEYLFVIDMYDRLAFDFVNLPLSLDNLEINQLYLRAKNISY